MKGRPAGAVEAARLLRQRLELGEAELVLSGLDRAEAIRLARTAREAGPSPRGAAATRAPAPAREAGASPGERAGRPPSPGAAAGGDLPAAYDELRAVALQCTRCPLAETRTQVVFSDGAVPARLMVVGEAPGAREDATGLPFVGPAGRFLDLLLASVDLSRGDSVYIANVLKCRPPGNRNPLPAEIEACSPYLKRQIELVAPRAVLAVGTFAAQLLTGRSDSIGNLRGTVYAYQGTPLVVTYHPAALLRNAGWTRAFWHDLQLVRGVLDAS